MLQKIFLPYFKNKKWIDFILILGFFNPYFIEVFVYVGIEFAIGIVLAILAVNCFAKKIYICSTICLFLAISTYQIFFTLFFVYTAGYLYLQSKGVLNKNSFIEVIKMIFITGITTFANLFIVRLALKIGMIQQEVKRIAIYLSWTKRLKRIFAAYCEATLECFEMLPKGSVMILMLLTVILILIKLIKDKKGSINIVFYLTGVIAINVVPVVLFGLGDDV